MKQLKINPSITDRSEESLNKYLLEISHIPMVNTDEEVILAQAIHAGGKNGEKAKNKLITANLRFVVSVAKQYQNQGVPLTDLINEGNIGLITAAERFDETRGFKFISYAIWWIRQAILQSIAANSTMVRRPQSQIGISSKIKSVTNNFLQKNQRKPSDAELSEIIALETDKIRKAILSEAHISSIDAPINEDESSTMLDTLVSGADYDADRTVDYESMQSDLMQTLSAVLNDRERTIVMQSFGIGCHERALDDISSDLGLSRERVRQIRERSLDKVRKSRKSRFLLRHLG